MIGGIEGDNMALTACKECGSEVSTTANACPKCGAVVGKPSGAWKWVVGVPVALVVAFLGFGASVSNTPEGRERSADRDKYELCMKDLNDPLKDPGAKATIIRPVCERFRNEFVKKWGREP